MSLYSIAENILSDSEVDDKAARKLSPTGRKVHPKKKHDSGRASPREEQRKKRIVLHDSDLNESSPTSKEPIDKDLSLNQKYSFSIISKSHKTQWYGEPENLPYYNDLKIAYEKSIGKYFTSLNKIGLITAHGSSLTLQESTDNSGLLNRIKDVSYKLYEAYRNYIIQNRDYIILRDYYNSILQNHLKIKEMIDSGKKPNIDRLSFSPGRIANVAKSNQNLSIVLNKEIKNINEHINIRGTKPIDIINNVRKIWTNTSNKEGSFGKRAAILEYLKSQIKNAAYPDSYTKFYSQDPNNPSVLDSLDDFMNEVPDIGESIHNDDFVRFTTFSSLYKVLCDDPINPKWEDIEKEVRKNNKKVYNDVLSISLLKQFQEDYGDLIKSIGDGDEIGEKEKTAIDYDKVISVIDKNLSGNRKNTDIDWKKFMKKYLDVFKKISPDNIPEELKKYASFQSSNKNVFHRMKKTSSYHGVIHQGHPSGPTNTGWNSIDKRYIGEKHFESILASAKSMISDNPWFMSGWGDNPGDAPFRAALDLAITTADNSIYQSKIDSPTYEKLLNKLAKWDYETFKDTVLNAKKRKASESIYDEMERLSRYI